jgi:glutamine---fructose-6-phosphate transaminase (isomerizing)
MLAEILEQPQRVHDALEAAIPRSAALAAAVRGAEYAVLLGRGSSRSAATYGGRALRLFAEMPALVASPAELGWGDWKLPLERALVVAISQSGESLEMVAAAERARELDARLIVVTNTAGSTLAKLAARAEDTLLCCAGAELAVPATKSFTTSVACLLALAYATQPHLLKRARDQLPVLIESVISELRSEDHVLAELESFVLAGEGYGEAVAEEGAIKLRETLRLPVASFETSELLHGSINSAQPGMGVFTVGTDVLSHGLAKDVVRGAGERGATTVHVGEVALEEATHWIALPSAPPEWSGLLAILPIQLIAWATALARALDPDRPAGLTKVTMIGYASDRA